MNENWIEVSEKKEIKKLKRNDARGVLYLRIAWLSVFTLYVLRIVNSIYIWKEYTSISCIVFDVVGKLFNTLGLLVIFWFYHTSLKDNFIEKYKGTIWKTSGIVIEKRNDSKNENIYIVKYRKFGETRGFTTHSVESNLVDIQIGDVVKVVGCKKENSFELLDIYKSEEYYHIRFAELVIMNAFVIYGGITNFPASSHFGHVAFGFLIWKALVLSILIIINFIGGIVEKNKIGIFFSMVFLGLFIFFQEPKNLRNVIVDLYEGPMVMKDIEVCFSTKESPVRKGDRFSFYTVLYDKFGSKIDEIRIPEDVYESYIPCTSDVVYYKNSGVVVKHRRHGQ